MMKISMVLGFTQSLKNSKIRMMRISIITLFKFDETICHEYGNLSAVVLQRLHQWHNAMGHARQ